MDIDRGVGFIAPAGILFNFAYKAGQYVSIGMTLADASGIVVVPYVQKMV